MNAPRSFVRSLCCVALATALVGCGGGTASSNGAKSPDSGTATATATDFALDDIKGGRFQLSDHLGKEVILLDFWATWCDPCKAEMPHIVELFNKNKDKGFLAVGVSI